MTQSGGLRCKQIMGNWARQPRCTPRGVASPPPWAGPLRPVLSAVTPAITAPGATLAWGARSTDASHATWGSGWRLPASAASRGCGRKADYRVNALRGTPHLPRVEPSGARGAAGPSSHARSPSRSSLICLIPSRGWDATERKVEVVDAHADDPSATNDLVPLLAAGFEARRSDDDDGFGNPALSTTFLPARTVNVARTADAEHVLAGVVLREAASIEVRPQESSSR